jgi:hypothetical protein
MIQVIALSIFFKETQTISIWLIIFINNIIYFIKIDLIFIPNYLSHRLCLQTHFHNISWFIIKQPMWVSKPWYCSKEYPIKK